jgi:hypothetical protein
MAEQMLQVVRAIKNKLGRPLKISDQVFWELLWVKGSYVLTGIKQTKNNKLLLADWQYHPLKFRAMIETCFGKLI